MPAYSIAGSLSFYLGTYTQPGKSRGIYRGSLDGATGALGPLVLATETSNPSFLALAPDGKTLYAASEKDGAVEAFRVGADGLLALLNAQPSGGGGPCHVSADPAGGRVLVSNYGGGTVAAFPVGSDGALGAREGLATFAGSGPDSRRQEGPHAHAAYAVGGLVYAADLGSDRIWILTPPSLAAVPAGAASVPPGSGPRHLAFVGSRVYAVNELADSVSVFARDPAGGALTLVEPVPLLEPGEGKGAAAEIVADPSGNRLYVSVRGVDRIVLLTVGKDGRIEGKESVPAGVKGPRSIALSPDGGWLLAAGQDDGRLAAFRIDRATGKLAAAGGMETPGSPVCVLFAP